LTILMMASLVAVSPTDAPGATADAAAVSDAARTGNWERVRALVAGGLTDEDVNAADSDGTRPLHWAVRADELEVADLLLKAGADASARNRLGLTALYLAAVNGNAPMIRRLLDHGADPHQVGRTGETILMVATRSGDAGAVRVLLERGANPNVTEPQLQLSALMIAAEAGATGAVRALLEHNADIHSRSRAGAVPSRRMPCVGRTGCGSHGLGIVRGGLPEQGYQPPIPGDMTPLMFAAREGHVDAARLLLEAGADGHAVDKNGITPLLMAIGSNRIPAARLLVERGADIHAKDAYGRTPLFAAVEIRNVDLHYTTFEHMLTAGDRTEVLDFIGFLLEKGADPNVRVSEVSPLRSWMYLLGGSLAWVDFTGQTPFLLASLSGDVSAMRLLLEHGLPLPA
jgi:ankyrin repeat protein